jgi:hypothetical protein
MSKLRAVLTSFTKQRTYTIENDWSVLLLASVLEVGACLTLVCFSTRWVWVPALAGYVICTALCWWKTGFRRPLSDLLIDDRADLSYAMLATFAPPLVTALLVFIALAIGIVCGATLFVAAVALGVCAVGAVIALAGLALYGVALAFIYGWWIIVPVLFLALVAKVVLSRRKAATKRWARS